MLPRVFLTLGQWQAVIHRPARGPAGIFFGGTPLPAQSVSEACHPIDE